MKLNDFDYWSYLLKRYQNDTGLYDTKYVELHALYFNNTLKIIRLNDLIKDIYNSTWKEYKKLNNIKILNEFYYLNTMLLQYLGSMDYYPLVINRDGNVVQGQVVCIDFGVQFYVAYSDYDGDVISSLEHIKQEYFTRNLLIINMIRIKEEELGYKSTYDDINNIKIIEMDYFNYLINYYKNELDINHSGYDRLVDIKRTIKYKEINCNQIYILLNKIKNETWDLFKESDRIHIGNEYFDKDIVLKECEEDMDRINLVIDENGMIVFGDAKYILTGTNLYAKYSDDERVVANSLKFVLLEHEKRLANWKQLEHLYNRRSK